jgi:hypothetical protein
MPARDARPFRIAAALLIAAAAGAVPAPAAAASSSSRIAADPNELYERASERLQKGDLAGASADAAKLRDLIRTRPAWDPDGTYAKTLLPPLQGKIRRLKAAAAALDQWSDRSLATLKPPDLKSQISTVKDYTHWATSVVERLRTERDALIASSLAAPEERTILKRTPAYAHSERLFESDVLKQMADKTGDDILGLLSGDPRLESVLTRFRQLKRDLMEAIAARDALQARLEALERPDAPAPRGTWLPWTIAAFCGACAGVCARLARDRGRRLAGIEARMTRFDHTLPGAGNPDAGRHAA